MQDKTSDPPTIAVDEKAERSEFWTIAVGVVAYLAVGFALTVATKPLIGTRANLIPLLFLWLPISVGPPVTVFLVGNKQGWVLALALGVGLSPFFMWGTYEASTYALDIGLPLEEHNVNVERVYERKGVKSPNEWRVVDDKGREWSFPP